MLSLSFEQVVGLSCFTIILFLRRVKHGEVVVELMNQFGSYTSTRHGTNGYPAHIKSLVEILTENLLINYKLLVIVDGHHPFSKALLCPAIIRV